jgi:hypothetical protein
VARYQRLDELVAKADDLVGAHVTTDHAVGQARLKLDHNTTVGVRYASRRVMNAPSGIASTTLPRACGHERAPPAGPETCSTFQTLAAVPRFCLMTRGLPMGRDGNASRGAGVR